MKQSILLSLPLLLCLLSVAPADKKKPEPASHDVAIKSMKFEPAQIQIGVGESVTWTNKDDHDHTVTCKESFSSGNLSKGDTFQHTFTKAGKFNYACSYHPRMKGIVIVGGG
jgi:plastocyanin